jgi:hypothetical protein
VWEELQSNRKPEGTPVNSHSREALPLPSMWKEFQSFIKCDGPPVNSHRREELPLHSVWEELQSGKIPEETLSNAHGREALPLPSVWEEFPSVITSEGTQVNSHRREALYHFSQCGKIFRQTADLKRHQLNVDTFLSRSTGSRSDLGPLTVPRPSLKIRICS